MNYYFSFNKISSFSSFIRLSNYFSIMEESKNSEKNLSDVNPSASRKKNKKNNLIEHEFWTLKMNDRGSYTVLNNNMEAYVTKKTIGEKKYMECMIKKCKSRAKIITTLDENNKLQARFYKKANDTHSYHIPSVMEINEKKFHAEIVKTAKTDSMRQGQQIFQKVIHQKKFGNLRKNFNYNNKKSTIMNHKTGAYPTAPKTISELKLKLKDEDIIKQILTIYQEEAEEEVFLKKRVYHETKKNKKHYGFIFYHEKFINKLEIKNIHIDATFKCVPKGFYQLLIIGAISEKKLRPIAFCLMTGKMQKLYEKVFKHLRDELGITAKKIMTDFECSLRNAAKNIYSEATIQGCWFHYIQCIRRQAKSRKHKVFAEATSNYDAQKVNYIKFIFFLNLILFLEIKDSLDVLYSCFATKR